MRHFFFYPFLSHSLARLHTTLSSPPRPSIILYAHTLRLLMVSQVIDEGPESSIHVNRNPSAQTRFTPARGEVYNIIVSLRPYIYLYTLRPLTTFGVPETPYGKSFCIIVVRRHCAWRRRGYAADEKWQDARAAGLYIYIYIYILLAVASVKTSPAAFACRRLHGEGEKNAYRDFTGRSEDRSVLSIMYIWV